MERFLIYLLGGMGKFGKENFNEGNKWRVDLKNQLETKCSDYKVHVINPNNYHSFLDDTTYDSELEVMEFDLNKLRNCNIGICNFNDVNSLGTMAELAVAYERKIPIIGLCENGENILLHPWQKSMCHKIFTDRADLVDYVLTYYLD